MADNSFIDTVERLQKIYMTASKDPYPLSHNHLKTVKKEDLIEG